MFKKISLRWRMTIMTALLICICCIGLTIVLNFSAYRMANIIEAAPTTVPAQELTPSITDGFPMVPIVPSEQYQQATLDYRLESVIYTIVAVLIGSALTYYVAGRTLEPVKSLNKQVKNITINNLSTTLPVPPTKDEIAQLTTSFNEMTIKLYEAFELQQRFSMDAAHELRTPLTILQTKMDVFNKKEEHSVEEYQDLLTVIEKQTIRLRGLIKNLLDMTNMEIAEQDEIPLNELFEDILDELSYLAKEKEVTFDLKCQQVSIYGNVDLIHRAFYNLVENAVKYNIVGGQVNIEINQKSPTELTVFIRDTGIGIPDDLKKHVYEPFYRVDKSRSREMGGVGLGLSMVKSIIEKHGGAIEITNQIPRGSCFKINLKIK